jgi:hypothetical protein
MGPNMPDRLRELDGDGTQETDSRQITPKHQGKPAIIRDQRTRPVNNIHNLTKSAKPPSPVQIRAAPPIFQGATFEVSPSIDGEAVPDCPCFVPVVSENRAS